MPKVKTERVRSPQQRERGKKKRDEHLRGDKKVRKSKKDIECYKCHKMGHFAHECLSKRQGKNARGNDQSEDCAFVAENKYGKHDVSDARSNPSNKQIKELLSIDQSEVWLTDSGASRHMTYRREWFINYRPIKNGGTIALGDNEECNIAGEGTILIERFVDGRWREVRIKNVLYAPK